MIALDNGPADGDYARYLDQLVRERLVVAGTSASIASMDRDASTLSSDALNGRPAPRPATPATRAVATAKGMPSALRDARTTASMATAQDAFAVPSPSTPAPDLPLAKMFFSLLLGAALIVFGVVAQPLAWIAIAGGVAALVAAVRPLFNAPVVGVGTRPPGR